MDTRKDLTIGKAARKAGVGIETIRFYEREGVIPRPPKPADGYRVYPPETIDRIAFIRRAQALGFSLREIQELLTLCADPAVECDAVRARARTKLRQVDEKISELERIRGALERIIDACPGQGELTACTIIEALGPRPSAGRRPLAQPGTETTA